MVKNTDDKNNLCFILTEKGYEQITYAELCDCIEKDIVYRSKKFIPLSGVLLEVTEEQFTDFYKTKRRQKYIDERSAENADFSYDMLTTDDFNGEDILIDESEPPDELAVRSVLLDKLKDCLSLLSDEEKQLITELFYNEHTEREVAKKYGISQVAIHKRKIKIIEKLKKMMKI